MLDNDLIRLVIKTIIAGEIVAGIPNLPIAAAFQPTMQGVNTVPTAFIYKVGDRRLGFPSWQDVWDIAHTKMVHTELQQYESTFQLSALASQNPATSSQYTASDILNFCASILQSQASVAALEAAGVGILRVTDVRNPYFQDDRQQNQANPSFDFVLTHKQIISSSVPIFETVEIQVDRV